MATYLSTGIVLPDSHDNVSRIAYRANLQVINDKLIEGEEVLNEHMADYTSYKIATGLELNINWLFERGLL